MKRYYTNDKRGDLVEVDSILARELVRSGKRKPEDFQIEDLPVVTPATPRVETPFTNYGNRMNAQAMQPQMVLPGGGLAQAPAVGVFADPVSPTSQGAFSPMPATLPAPAPVVARPAPVVASAPVQMGAPAQEMAVRTTAMNTPGMTRGEIEQQAEREQVAADESEYQNYVADFGNKWEADKVNRSGRAILDSRLSDGSRAMTRDEFAKARAGFKAAGTPDDVTAIDRFFGQRGVYMPENLRATATRSPTLMQDIGGATEFASRTVMKPVLDMLPGNEDGFSDLSHASRVRRNFETQAQVDDLRSAQRKGSALTDGEMQFLYENDPGVVDGTVRAVKEIPGMISDIANKPEVRRQFLEGMATDLPASVAVSGGASMVGDAMKAFSGARRLKNVRKAFEGRITPAVMDGERVVKAAYTAEDAAKKFARWQQMDEGKKAIESMWEAVRKHPSMATEIVKETLGDGLADALVETLHSNARGEQGGVIENLISGMPLDIAPYLAINTGKRAMSRAVNGLDNGLTRPEFDAARGALDLSPTVINESGLPVAPGVGQKAGSTATRPQVEAALSRVDIKDNLKQIAALARNPETAGTRYRLGNEDLVVDMTDDQLAASGYEGRDGQQSVRGYHQPGKRIDYSRGAEGALLRQETDQPTAHIALRGDINTVAHETIHGIENRIRKAGYADATGNSADARIVDMVDDWTERAYEWGKRNGVILPGPKELLTQAMTYRLGWSDDFDDSVKRLPVPDELVQAFAERAGRPVQGEAGMRKDGTRMEDMPLPKADTWKPEPIAKPEPFYAGGDEDLPFSFAGKNARNADQGALAEAERRLDAGEDRDAVRKSTGWFRGADGKMRFEVDDSKAKLKNESRDPENFADVWHEAEIRERGLPLGSVLDHPELFRAYPILQSFRVKIQNSGAHDGSFDPSSKTIYVKDPHDYRGMHETLKSVLLHEIQHAIQEQEGFARGGSERGMVNDYLDDKARLEELSRKILDRQNKYSDEARWASDELEAEAIQWAKSMGEFFDDIPTVEKVKEYLLSRDELYNDWYQEHADLKYTKIKSDPMDRYRRLAGETEARNTQTRRDLAADQRSESAPWDTQDVKDGEQIIRFSLASDAGIRQHRADDPATIELARKQWAEKGVESPFFKKWFRGSKVVDAEGKPLVLYHGTTADFTEFDMGKSGTGANKTIMPEEGFFFSPSADAAHEFGRFNGDESVNVKPVYLNIKNPMEITMGRYSNARMKAAIEKAKSLGHDGLFASVNEAKDFESMQYVAFSPNQIKSATGNRGTFDEGDADIRYSLAKSDPRQKILTHMSKVLRSKGLLKSQNDLSTEWGAIPESAKNDPTKRQAYDQKWKEAEEALRSYVMDNQTTAREAGLNPPVEGHADEFDVQDAIWKFRDWTNASTESKFSPTEREHFHQARVAAQSGSKAAGHDEHGMSKRTLAGLAKTGNRKGGSILFESLGEGFTARSNGAGGWIVKHDKSGESFDVPRDGSVWIDGETPMSVQYNGPEGPVPKEAGQNARAQHFGDNDLAGTEREDSARQLATRSIVDSLDDLANLESRLKNEDASAYRAYDLAHGKTDYNARKAQERFLRPIMVLMKRHGFSQADVDSYLYAKHAKAVNAYVATINKDLPYGGSGMSNADADKILTDLKTDAVKWQGYEAIGALNNKLNDWRMDLEVKSGLRSEADAIKLRKEYPDYVPLRGLPNDETGRPGVGKGQTAKQDNKKRMGRKSKAENVLAQNFALTLDAIVNAERNIAARELWKMAGANPDPKYWAMDPAHTKPTLVTNKETGKKEVQQAFDRMARQAPGVVPLFIDGEAHYLEMKTPEGQRFAEAIKGLSSSQSNIALQYLGKANRMLASLITTYSPEFILTNLSRDALTAMIVSYGRDGAKVSANTMKGILPAMTAIWGNEAGVRTGHVKEWADWKERWEAAGGKVGFMQSMDFHELAKDVDTQLQDMGRSKYNPKKMAHTMVDLFDKANSGVESATRLSYFRALVENGMDEKKAAQKSKELTTNFNRRGDQKWLNQVYMFFNAAIQGTNNIYKLLSDKDPAVRKRARHMVGFLFGAGAGITMYNMMAGGEDENSGKAMYEKKAAFEKANQVVLMMPNGSGSAVTIPLPYGFNLFYNMGRLAVEGATRKDGYGGLDMASEMMSNAVAALNPVGVDLSPADMDASIATLATPSIVRPVAELARNKDFSGRPIAPDGKAGQPDSQKFNRGVNPLFKHTAALLNSSTGGDEFHPGGVDVSPESIEHVFNAYTGGLGRFMQQGTGIATTLAEGKDDVRIRQIPFLRRYFSEQRQGIDRGEFRNIMEGAKRDLDQLNAMAKKDDPETDKFVVDHYANVVASVAFGRLKSKETRLRFAEELGERFGESDLGDEYDVFFAKAWKAKQAMDRLQGRHNESTNDADRKELRKLIEKEAEKAFEGFGK